MDDGEECAVASQKVIVSRTVSALQEWNRDTNYFIGMDISLQSQPVLYNHSAMSEGFNDIMAWVQPVHKMSIVQIDGDKTTESVQ